MSRPASARLGEYSAVTVCSLAGYGVVFSLDGMIMVFPLLVFTAWAAARLSTNYVALHSAAATLTAVLFTLAGQGPFAHLSDVSGVLVGQLYAATVTLIGLVLALSRDERVALTDALAAEKQRAIQQATLLNTVVNSMADGLAVIDLDGRHLLCNPMIASLLGARPPVADKPDLSSHYGLHDLDGTRLPRPTCPPAGRSPTAGHTPPTSSSATPDCPRTGSSAAPRLPWPTPTARSTGPWSCCATSPLNAASATNSPASPGWSPMTCRTH